VRCIGAGLHRQAVHRERQQRHGRHLLVGEQSARQRGVDEWSAEGPPVAAGASVERVQEAAQPVLGVA